jgi:hypothetical protein
MRRLIFLCAICLMCSSPQNNEDNNPYVPPPYQPPEKSYIDSVPSGSPHPYAIKEYSLPTGWTAMTAWVQAIHNPLLGNTSKVEIDYIRTYYSGAIDNTITLINEQNYDNVWDTAWGGLYVTSPKWFATEGKAAPMFASTENGIMTFNPSDNKDYLYHFWPPRQISVPADMKKVWIEIRFRLSGAACLQFGGDWWRYIGAPSAEKDVNNSEIGVSNWYFSSPEWRTAHIYY